MAKHTVTLPEQTAAAVRSRAGPRGFSAYVARAVTRQLERDAMDDLLAAMEARHGPVDEAEVAAIMERLTTS